MAFEIERKFLVKNDSWIDFAVGVSEIRQAYITSHDKASIRVRIRDSKSATLTVKSRGAALRRLELEYEIPVIEAEAMLPLCIGSIIEKRRTLVRRDNELWEVDTFTGDNAGLVIAEIELKSEDQVFRRPSWLGSEVTGVAGYYNSALAMHPFVKWSEDDRAAVSF